MLTDSLHFASMVPFNALPFIVHLSPVSVHDVSDIMLGIYNNMRYVLFGDVIK